MTLASSLDEFLQEQIAYGRATGQLPKPRTPKPYRPASYDGGTHPALARWENDSDEFGRIFGEGTRNSRFGPLCIRARSLELSGLLVHGEGITKMRRMVELNGYAQSEGPTRIEDQIARHILESERTYSSSLAKGGVTKYGDKSTTGGGIASHSIVPSLLSTRTILPQTTHIAHQVQNSSLQDAEKRGLLFMLAWFTKNRFIKQKYSARAGAASAHISKTVMARALSAADADKSISIRIIKGHGSDEPGKIGRTTVVILDIEGLSTTMPDNPTVDLSMFIEGTEMTDEYIKDKRAADRQRRNDWVREHDVSGASNPSQSPSKATNRRNPIPCAPSGSEGVHRPRKDPLNPKLQHDLNKLLGPGCLSDCDFCSPGVADTKDTDTLFKYLTKGCNA